MLFVAVTAAYAVLALSAYELFGADSIGSTFFPPAGLTFACFLLLPRNSWLVVAGAIVVGEVVVDMGYGNGLWWSLGWAAANLVEPFIGAQVTRRIAPVVALTRRFAFAVVVGGLVAGPILGAAIGATVMRIADGSDWWDVFADVWVGDALGVLVVAPCIIVLARSKAFAPSAPRRADPLVVLAAMAVFGVILFRSDNIPAGYAAVPLLALTALRYSAREVSLASLVVAGTLTAATAHGSGPWAVGISGGVDASLREQQVFLIVAIVGAWALKLEVRERTFAVRAAEAAQLRLAQAAERAREQRYLADMYDALSDFAAATTTQEVASAAVEHSRTLFDAVETTVWLDDLGSKGWQEITSGAKAHDGVVDLALWEDARDRAIATGRPVFDPPTSIGGKAGRRAGVESDVAVLPFSVGPQRMGVAAIVRAAGLGWSEGAQVRAMAFVSIVADALDRTEHMEAQQLIAHTLQEALVPDRSSTLPGALAAGRHLPASDSLEIGGDWYDVVVSDPHGSATLIIGDVVGHGLREAAAMGTVAAAARALAYAEFGPAAILEVLDRVAAHTPEAKMTTVFCAQLDPSTGTLRYSSAGHPPAVLVEPDGQARLLVGGRGLPLAIEGPERREEAEVQLSDGCMLCMYTDGLVERRGEPIDVGLARLQRLLGETDRSDPSKVCEHVMGAIIGPASHDDDVAMLCVTLCRSSDRLSA